MNTEIRTSKHAKTRMKERCGLGKKAAERMSILATERGCERVNTKGALRNWLDGKARESQKLYVYGDKAYIFSRDMILITVLQVPTPLTKNMKKMMCQPA